MRNLNPDNPLPDPPPIPPVVLCLSGHDPSGGAGLQADIESIRSLGAHAAVGITCLTRQDTRNVYAVEAVSDPWFADVLDTLLDDLPVAAIKVGVLGSPAQARLIAEAHQRLGGRECCPLILDPVLVASGGGRLADDPTSVAMAERLLPAATLLTPNLAEARTLSGGDSPADCAGKLLAKAVSWVLITGGEDDGSDTAIDRLYGADGSERSYAHHRLAHSCHGSGCSLASACAALLAAGSGDVPAAVAQATGQVRQWLAQGFRPGRHADSQYIPRRQR